MLKPILCLRTSFLLEFSDRTDYMALRTNERIYNIKDPFLASLAMHECLCCRPCGSGLWLSILALTIQTDKRYIKIRQAVFGVKAASSDSPLIPLGILKKLSVNLCLWLKTDAEEVRRLGLRGAHGDGVDLDIKERSERNADESKRAVQTGESSKKDFKKHLPSNIPSESMKSATSFRLYSRQIL